MTGDIACFVVVNMMKLFILVKNLKLNRIDQSFTSPVWIPTAIKELPIAAIPLTMGPVIYPKNEL